MDRARIVAMLLAGLILCSATGSHGERSPFPDPEERAAFQREELSRQARFFHPTPVDPDRAREQNAYDAVYYRLALDLLDPGSQTPWLYGDLTADLLVVDDSLETILFDFADLMQVDSVFVNGNAASFTHEVYDLRIDLDEIAEPDQLVRVRVYYQGHPRETGFFAFGWASHDEGIPLIWSLSEPSGAREWWPCKDHPDDKADSLDVLLHVEDWMVATSNGLLVDEIDHGDGTKTFHWKHRYPITTYLVSIAATDYKRFGEIYVSADSDTMLLEHFVYPEKLSQAQEDFSITAEAIDLLAGAFGPYPFLDEKYGHSLFPFGGAMEHQTNTSYGGNLVTGQHIYDYILVHELAHQWWGDMTSPADWRDIWLNEGFASFAEALWFEHTGGSEDYRAFMNNSQSVYDPSGPLYDPPALFDGNTVYNKGAWVVHMLRGVLGDAVFYDVFDAYRERTAYRSTTTAEFQSIAEEISGRDLDWFFNPWVYGMNRPHYSVSFLPVGEPGLPAAAIHLEQTQEDGTYFPMPVELEIGLDGGGFIRETVWNGTDHEDYELDLPATPVQVIVDPDSWILKETATAGYSLHITTTELPEGVQDSTFEFGLVGRGGTPPYQWTAVDSLPVGILLDGETGRLAGAAPSEGVYPFELRVTDALALSDAQRFEWTVIAYADTSVVDPPDTTIVEVPEILSLRVGLLPAHQHALFYLYDPDEGPLTLTIFDLQGRKIDELWNGPAPERAVSWNGRNQSGVKVASGVYLARLRSATGAVTRRVVWLWAK